MSSGQGIGTLAGIAVGIGAVLLAPATFGTSLAVAGATISIGATLGGIAGSLYDSAHTKFDDVVNRQERLADLSIQTSTLGIPIPQIWGKVGGLAGNVIWYTEKVPHENREVIEAEGGGGLGKGGPSGPRQINITITYTQSYALALCDTRLSGPVEGLSKIWKNSNLFWDRAQNGDALPDGWTLYLGTATQAVDPTMEAALGVGQVPRYPYLCYVVVADDDQGRSGQTPVYTFEVLQATSGTTLVSSLAVSPTTGDIWITLPAMEQVARIDETTRTRLATVQLGPTDPQGYSQTAPIAIDSGGIVWTADLYNNTVYRISGASNAILHSIVLGATSVPASNIVFSAGDAWICAYSNLDLTMALHRLTAAGGNTAIALGTTGAIPRLAVGADGDIWVANVLYDAFGAVTVVNLTRVDEGTHALTVIPSIADAHDVLVDASGRVWVAATTVDAVYRVNAATNTISATITTCADPVRLGLASDGYLWVASRTTPAVSRINPADNSVQTFTAEGQTDPSTDTQVWAAGASGAMWVTGVYTNTASLITTTGTTMAVRTGMAPGDIAVGAGTTVWVVSTQGGNLHHIDVDGSSQGLVTGNDLPSIVTSLCTAVGLTAITVSELPDNLVSMILLNVEAARVPLEQLALAYRFYAVESGLTLAFRERGSGGLLFALTEDELGAGEGQADVTGLQVTRAQEADLPTSIDVQYVDPGQNYQRNTQSGQLALPASGVENARSVNIGSVVLSADSARQLATELAVESWVARETVQTTLRRKYAYLEPGDRGTITARGLTYTVVLTETSYGAPGLVEVTGRVDAAYIRNAIIAVPGVVTPAPQEPTTVLGETTVLLLNLYALSGTDQTARYHVAYIGETEPWEGGALYRSLDGGTSYGLLDAAALEGITGAVALATASADWHFLDTTTSISVVLEYGSLSSISDVSLLAGGNLCAIGNETNGWEILGFGVATLTATRTYTLTRLLRGRRGTEFEVSGHGVNETFVQLDAGVRTIGMNLSDRHVLRPYKSVTAGQDITDVTAVTFTPTANNLTPWTVAQGGATKVVDDWVLVWFMRSRFNGMDDFSPIGFDSDFVGFRVDIFQDNTYAVVLRSTATDGGNPLDANIEKTWTYAAADQTTDFGGIQTVLYFRVYQTTNNGLSVAENLAA